MGVVRGRFRPLLLVTKPSLAVISGWVVVSLISGWGGCGCGLQPFPAAISGCEAPSLAVISG